MLFMEDSLRQVFPLAFVGDRVADCNNHSTASMCLDVTPNGLFGAAGCFWWLAVTPDQLEALFPELDLIGPLHGLSADFNSTILVERIETKIPPHPPQGPSQHGVCGGELHFEATINRRGFRLFLSDKKDNFQTGLSNGIYLKRVDITDLLPWLRRHAPKEDV